MRMLVGLQKLLSWVLSNGALMIRPMNFFFVGSWFPGSPLPIDLSPSLPPKAVRLVRGDTKCMLFLGYNPYLVQRET